MAERKTRTHERIGSSYFARSAFFFLQHIQPSLQMSKDESLNDDPRRRARGGSEGTNRVLEAEARILLAVQHAENSPKLLLQCIIYNRIFYPSLTLNPKKTIALPVKIYYDGPLSEP